MYIPQFKELVKVKTKYYPQRTSFKPLSEPVMNHIAKNRTQILLGRFISRFINNKSFSMPSITPDK